MSEKLIEVFLFPIPNRDYSSRAGRRTLRSITTLKKFSPYYKLYLSKDYVKKRFIPHYTINTEQYRPPFKKGVIVKTNYRVIERIPNSTGTVIFVYATQASQRKIN